MDLRSIFENFVYLHIRDHELRGKSLPNLIAIILILASVSTSTMPFLVNSRSTNAYSAVSSAALYLQHNLTQSPYLLDALL